MQVRIASGGRNVVHEIENAQCHESSGTAGIAPSFNKGTRDFLTEYPVSESMNVEQGIVATHRVLSNGQDPGFHHCFIILAAIEEAPVLPDLRVLGPDEARREVAPRTTLELEMIHRACIRAFTQDLASL
jgi:hypothetical protein